MMHASSSSSSGNASFYIVLPSNTSVEGNRSNSFRIRLPRKLHFGSAWSVGLAVLVYPHSWPSLGTTESQHIRVEWQTGESLKIDIAAANLRNPAELLARLQRALDTGGTELSKRLAALQTLYKRVISEVEAETKKTAIKMWTSKVAMPAESEGKEAMARALDEVWNHPNVQKKFSHLRAEAIGPALVKAMSEEERELWDRAARMSDGGDVGLWINAYAQPGNHCRFSFDSDAQRFRLKFNERHVRAVELSAQLAYILGFHPTLRLDAPLSVASYMPDMSGGVSSFYVYAPDLIESVFIGNVAAPVLRVVNIRGAPDEIVEECYVAIQYHRLIAKEFSEIFIEIRTASGTLMPFQYGTCTLTLHFKKLPYF